jgi:mono/diheme cytochrome c family protein
MKLASILALTLVLFAPVAKASDADSGYLSKASLASADGERIFTRICQGCHMPDARGATGAGHYPSLSRSPMLNSAAYMALVIMNGRRDMPAFGTVDDAGLRGVTLSPAQVAAVVNYVRSHFGNTFDDAITVDQVTALLP